MDPGSVLNSLEQGGGNNNVNGAAGKFGQPGKEFRNSSYFLRNEAGVNPNNNNNSNSSGGRAGPGPGPPGQDQQQQQQQQDRPQVQQQPQQYSIPGILHFLQYEWQRFELERQQWDIERAELQARIALLQGERKGQENLKSDLVRRIKMLEYCLRHERAKYQKSPHGIESSSLGTTNEEIANIHTDPLLEDSLLNDPGTGNTEVNWKHGRQLLRQYLQEIGYTDTIIDVRSNRVRSLLGLNNTNSNEDICDQGKNNNIVPAAQTKQVRRTQSPSSSIVADAEASVLATFEFLNEQSRDHAMARSSRMAEDEEDVEEDVDDEGVVDDESGRDFANLDTETEEVLAEFDFLSAHPTFDRLERNDIDRKCWKSNIANEPGKGDVVDIGELAALTVANESMDINASGNNPALQSSMNGEFRKTWNPRYILKSHFDCIRCLRFHKTEPLLVTCSEDETLKLWNLNKTQPQSNKAGKQQAATAAGTTFDLEPIYTFRGHTSRVLSMAINNSTIYSGAQNGELFIWSIPGNTATIDPYDAYDASLSVGNLEGHTDAIWSIVILNANPNNPSSDLLCTASADSTIKIWDTSLLKCIKTIELKEPCNLPTCLVNIPPHNNNNASDSPSLLAASFTNGSIHIYNTEATDYSQPILKISETEWVSPRINCIVVHPTMPVIVSAHEDKQIKFWDFNTGKCLNAMVAHLDEVTCLACDPNGLYLLSGSHDCSVRLWNFDTRTCVQEITSHRKKFDEAIFDVTFHLTRPYFASAGADALAKVFV